MRDVVLSMSVSLDGYIEGPGRDIGWHRVDEELHRHFNDELGTMGAFLSGRVTYELMAGFWPTADADPAASPAVVEFAGIWRNMPKIVYSRTLADAEGNTTVVRDIVPAEVQALKEQPGGDLAVGGAGAASAFVAQDLVDEYRVYVHPVLVGRGTPLFPVAGGRHDLRLLESRAFGNGVVLLRYRRAAEAG